MTIPGKIEEGTVVEVHVPASVPARQTARDWRYALRRYVEGSRRYG